MANNVQVIEKNEGQKVEFVQSGTRMFFGDDEIMVNCSKYQKDWPVHLDICANKDRNLVIGVGEGLYYVAQLDIPPIEYEEQVEIVSDIEGMPEPPRIAKPIDMGKVILTLWNLDDLTPADEA